jgi:predicted DNA-binding transcriptional regulator AlpA
MALMNSSGTESVVDLTTPYQRSERPVSARHKPGPDFDPAAFLSAIDAQREARGGISYRQVAREAGISPSIFAAISQGRSPDVVTLGRLLVWLRGETPFWMTVPK